MSIAIDKTLLSDAKVFNFAPVSQNLNLCKLPQEGMKAIPIQIPVQPITPDLTSTWLIDLTKGTPNPPISQLCAIYVINQVNAPCTFYFPDSGYQIDLEIGDKGLFPVLAQNNGNAPPKFYVFFREVGNYPNDYLEVILLNQYVPGFFQPFAQKSLAFTGLGSTVSNNTVPIPDVRVSQSMPMINYDYTTLPQNFSIGNSGAINKLHGLQVWADVTANIDNSRFYLKFTNALNTQNIFFIPFTASTTRSGVKQICNISDLDIIIVDATATGILLATPYIITSYFAGSAGVLTQGVFDFIFEVA
jgi:hypothetical protein